MVKGKLKEGKEGILTFTGQFHAHHLRISHIYYTPVLRSGIKPITGTTRDKWVILLTRAKLGKIHDKRQLDEENIPDEVVILVPRDFAILPVYRSDSPEVRLSAKAEASPTPTLVKPHLRWIESVISIRFGKSLRMSFDRKTSGVLIQSKQTS